MIWLLALQLSLPPQQQHYDNAKNDLARMQFGPADEEVDLALRLDSNFVPALILKARLALFAHRPDIAKRLPHQGGALIPHPRMPSFSWACSTIFKTILRLGFRP